jgi:hypothetical protein
MKRRQWKCSPTPDTGVMAAELVPVAAALKSMKRSNSGVTWIRQRRLTALLKDPAVALSITHEKLDELPTSPRQGLTADPFAVAPKSGQDVLDVAV